MFDIDLRTHAEAPQPLVSINLSDKASGIRKKGVELAQQDQPSLFLLVFEFSKLIPLI